MPHPKKLTRADILRAARDFTWTRKMPKWTVLIDNRELPARPLVLEAAGVNPNDPTNSHQAVAILESLGFETRYANGTRKDTPNQETDAQRLPDKPSIFDLIAEIRESVPEEAWDQLPTDLSKNVDHYLYGAKKIEE